MPTVLELREVVKDFPGHRAVDKVSLSLERGGFYALLGPSGCGKTTTLRMIGGFEQATFGDVILNGEVINAKKPYDRDVCTVFQSYALFPHLTARGNVEFGLRERGIRDRAERARARWNWCSLPVSTTVRRRSFPAARNSAWH